MNLIFKFKKYIFLKLSKISNNIKIAYIRPFNKKKVSLFHLHFSSYFVKTCEQKFKSENAL